MGQVLQAGAGQAPGAPGRDRRRAAEGDAGGHDQQGLRLVDPRRPDRRHDDPRRRPRGDRHGRDGVDVERAVPAQEGALRLPARPRRADRLDDLRRPHRRLRLAAHGAAQLDGLPRARHQPRGAGRVGVPVAAARRRGTGGWTLRGRDRRRRRRDRGREHPPGHDARVAREAQAGVRPRGDDHRRQRAWRERRRLLRDRHLGGVRGAARPRDPGDDRLAGLRRRRLRLSRADAGERRGDRLREGREDASTTSSGSRSTRRSRRSRSIRRGCSAPTRRS